jgi:preprotein translocase subunit SecY
LWSIGSAFGFPCRQLIQKGFSSFGNSLGSFLGGRLSAGTIEHLSVFALGLTPYLNAAIFFSLIAFRSSKLRTLFLSKERTF